METRTLTLGPGDTFTQDGLAPGDFRVQALVPNVPGMVGTAQATVAAGQAARVTITLQPGTVVAAALVVHFRFDSAFVEPCMRPVLRAAAARATAQSQEKVVIVGHTDKAGPPDYNQSLSERRARSVFAFLTAGRDRTASLAEWNGLRQPKPPGTIKTANDGWGLIQAQHMLQDLDFYPGAVDGQDGPLTRGAINAFRCQHGLPPGTTMDDPTWEALIAAYLDQDALALPANRFLPNCAGEILKWVGCGEESPLPLPQPTRPRAFRPYRRVEILFVQASALPCQVPPPDTLDMRVEGSGVANWCLGPGQTGQHCCFGSTTAPAQGSNQFFIQPVDSAPITVTGSIKNEDGTERRGQQFVLIAPDGEIKQGEGSSGEQFPAVTDAHGNFTIGGKTEGVYSLEVKAPVLVRLATANVTEARGNAVCATLRSDTDHLDVVVVDAPRIRELRLPVSVHLMSALHPATREFRRCPDSLNPAITRAQATLLEPDDVQALFDGANKVWQQARIRLDPVDVVREAYSFRTDCEVDGSEFGILLERCGHPNVLNLFFFGDLAGTGEAGFGISVEDGVPLNLEGGCAVGDFFEFPFGGALITQQLSTDQQTQTLAHEFGHYLNLGHVAGDTRLMLDHTTDGKNLDLAQDEVTKARASRGAARECRPFSLTVTGAEQIGGTLSHEFVVVVDPAKTVTVDADISDALLAAGTLSMTSGGVTVPGTQAMISAATKGETVVVATYTPAAGGDPFTTRVSIRVLEFPALRVEGATQTGGPTATRFIAQTDPTARITVVARPDPEPFCVPEDLVTWRGGDEPADFLRRTASRRLAGSTTVTATIAGVSRSVTIVVFRFSFTSAADPFGAPLDRVRIEGVLNADMKSLDRADLIRFQTPSLFHVLAEVAGIPPAVTSVTVTLTSTVLIGPAVPPATITLTRKPTGSDTFLSPLILAIPTAIQASEITFKSPKDMEAIRAQAGGSLRALAGGALKLGALGTATVQVRGRVVFLFGQTFVTAQVTAADNKATAADIRRQIARASRVWAQAGIEVRERSVNDHQPAPGGLEVLHIGTTDAAGVFHPSAEEQRLEGTHPNCPAGCAVHSAVVTDVNVYYMKDIDGPPSGASLEPFGVIALEGPSITDLALAHEVGHTIIRGWPHPPNIPASDEEHRDQTGVDWPSTNVLNRFDTGNGVDVDRTQAQHLIDPATPKAPFVVMQP